jgi:hypothetical protein
MRAEGAHGSIVAGQNDATDSALQSGLGFASFPPASNPSGESKSAAATNAQQFRLLFNEFRIGRSGLFCIDLVGKLPSQ